MRDSAHGQQSGCAIWMRTGRWRNPEASAGIERKFNPWHDPDDGRFTFAGQGRHHGSGGTGSSAPTQPRKRRKIGTGGGSFGGAGAHASYGGSAPTRSVRKPAPRKPSTPLRAVPGPTPLRTRPSVKPAPARPIRTPRWRKVVRNGYIFQLDELDNTRQIDGTLTDEAKTQDRVQPSAMQVSQTGFRPMTVAISSPTGSMAPGMPSITLPRMLRQIGGPIGCLSRNGPMLWRKARPLP